MKEMSVRKMEALKIIAMINERIKIIEHSVIEQSFAEAEAETLILRDLVKSLLITIRRLERL